jgi:acetyl/propionyl-CoA carboxylase alpha subunit
MNESVRRKKALVLGEPVPAKMIGKQLEQEGYDIVFQESFSFPLPSVADPMRIEILRQFFREFSLLAGPNAAVHPGTTLWAERAEFPSLAQEVGLTAICPSARVLSTLGNQINFLTEAERLGIPNLLQSFDLMYSLREIEEFIRRTNQTFPFILRSVHGGGGDGEFFIEDIRTLEKRLPLWINQLRKKLGEVILFVERYVEGARRVVLPFARFQDGRFQTFPTIDASLRSKQRKVLEFCPATQISQSILNLLEKWSKTLADHWGYIGVGAFEFLVDDTRAYLTQSVPRLTTSFHLWDQVAGTQAVSWQVSTLDNYSVVHAPALRPPEQWGHGVSAQIFAEDSIYHIPQPGKITQLSETRAWIFQDTSAELSMNYQLGQEVTQNDSGLIGVLQTISQNRETLLSLTQKILEEIWISGSLQTSERFLLELVSHPWVREEMFHVGFIDEEFLPLVSPSQDWIPYFVGVLQKGQSNSQTTGWVVGDIRLTAEMISEFLREPVSWVERSELNSGEILGSLKIKDGKAVQVHVVPLSASENRWIVRIGSWTLQVKRIQPLLSKTLPKQTRLSALSRGTIDSILYRPGIVVPAYEPLLILESLGCLIPHALPVPCKVMRWNVSTEQSVDFGQELAVLELLTKENMYKT